MPLHPRQARWFEVRVPRDQTVHALEVLAGTGSVQLEEKGYQTAPCIDANRLHRQLARFDELLRRYEEDLPSGDARPTPVLEEPERLAADSVQRLQVWSSELLELKRRVRALEKRRDELALVAECISAMKGASGELGSMEHATRLLYKNVFFCPKGQIAKPVTDDRILTEIYAGETHDFWLVVGEPERHEVLDGTATLFGCSPLRLPDWLPSSPEAQERELATRLEDLDTELATRRRELQVHRGDAGIGKAIANMRLLRWYRDIAITQTPDHTACQVTGWTTAPDPETLQRDLAGAGITATVLFAEPRGDLRPPVQLSSARWSRPFQLFVRLLGAPGRYEVDPTPLLAVIVPLLFGFMFPDLGHGLVLAAAGALTARRVPAAVILVPCGLAAAGFGLLFGEVFGIRGLLPVFCGCPLEHPVETLIVTLIVGVALMSLGMVFAGIEAWWRGERRSWLLEGAPVILLYLSAALSLIWRPALAGSAIALTWYLAGIAVLCKTGSGCMVRRLGHLLESALQLLINTLSFLRVGAFALAHAAFSVVVLELARAPDQPALQALVFVTGQAVVVVLEGLVVMVQTTRLVVFEFFIRFLRFNGRIYRPMSAPPGARTDQPGGPP